MFIRFALFACAAVTTLGFTSCSDGEVITHDFVVALSGSSEVPPVTTAASGTATIDVDNPSMTVTINVTTTGISPNPTAAHLHDNFAGANGPVLFGLTQQSNLNNFSGTTTLTAAQIENLYNGGFYINVHSEAVPSGELRGQVVDAGVTLISFPLEGSQEVPATATAATGNAVVTVIGDEAVEVRASHNVQNTTAAHIHAAPAGTNGGVLEPLTQTAATDSALGTISGSISGEALTDQIRTGLADGGLYVNLHSSMFGGGELRGQIIEGGVPTTSQE